MQTFKVKAAWDREPVEIKASDTKNAAIAFVKARWPKTKDRNEYQVEVTPEDGGVRRYKVSTLRSRSLPNVTRIYSPPLKLFRVVREGQGKQWDLSRLGSDHADQSAVNLAIVSGMTFDPDDVMELADTYGHHAGEGDYAIACGRRGVDNRSFCQSYERWRGRKPFIVRDRDNKTGTRMHVRREFQWLVDGKMVTLECTSFAADGLSFIGTLTEKPRNDKGWSAGPTKVLRRIRITHDDIKAWHRHLDGETDPEKPAKKRGRKS